MREGGGVRKSGREGGGVGAGGVKENEQQFMLYEKKS